ncbi:hypothetical protein [Desulfonatronum thiosulfatophilum]|nr:hypothetical protein [Desulfonatronum thiosulfatophilum]
MAKPALHPVPEHDPGDETGQRRLFIAVYMGFYILATSLSLPEAAVLTLAGGALFGLWVGTLFVSFAGRT